jgi:hypothetical protein
MKQDYFQEEIRRPNSQLGHRRIGSAQKIALDARFLRYTKRPSTSSALFVSLRTPDAPLDGTEEERYENRILSDQGKEYDQVREMRNKTLRKSLGFRPKTPPKTPMGDYCIDQVQNPMKERESLFSRLNSKPLTELEALEASVREKANETKSASEAKIAEKVEMVNGKRSRFVDHVAVPPIRTESSLRNAIRTQKEDEKKKMEKSIGISDETNDKLRNEIENELTGETQKVDHASIQSASQVTKGKKDALKKRLFLRSRKQQVSYGKNRISSTHNSLGTIEAPWVTTSGRYTTRKGDRTN